MISGNEALCKVAACCAWSMTAYNL